MKYDMQNQSVLNLINNHIGYNVAYLEKANLIKFITNKNNHQAVIKCILAVYNKHENEDDKKRHFINYINLLIKNKLN